MTFHHFLRAAVSGGFSAYIIYLVKNDLLQYYIAPRMEIYVKIAAVALICIAVYQVFAALASVRGEQLDCGCAHPPPRSFWRNFTAYGLLAAPLLLGYFLPDMALGSVLAEKKGIFLAGEESASLTKKIRNESATVEDLPSDTLPLTDAQLKEMFTTGDAYTDQYTKFAIKLYKQDTIVVEDAGFLETSTAIDLFMDRFVGKRIQIEGFVYREDNMKSDNFVVARMAMECCSADSSPYGLLVRTDKALNYPEDSWVRVTGTIATTDWDGIEIVQVEAEEIEKIPAPETPYVYPNYDILN